MGNAEKACQVPHCAVKAVTQRAFRLALSSYHLGCAFHTAGAAHQQHLLLATRAGLPSLELAEAHRLATGRQAVILASEGLRERWDAVTPKGSSRGLSVRWRLGHGAYRGTEYLMISNV